MTDPDKRHEQVIDDLLALIREHATEPLLEEIADGDSYAMPEDRVKHLAALHELRDHYDWRLRKQPDNSWYPCEPIELIAYAVDGRSRLAEMFCNALLVVSELDGTEQDYMNYRWFQSPGEAWFRGLDDPWRSALLAGFALRHAEGNELERAFWQGPDAKGRWIAPKGEEDG
ncbi:MAG: hypothetical protein AAFN80_03105 [Pseudomonadota bacterium]